MGATTTKLPEEEHAALGASGMEIWANCAGSYPLTQGLPDQKSIYAAEGTVAHALGQRRLEGTRLPRTLIGDEVEADGFKIEITAEMLDCVEDYFETCEGFVEQFRDKKLSFVTHIEARMSLDKLNLGVPLFGTGDFLLWVPAIRKLVLIDLKYGQGKPVSPDWNWQLLYYAVAACLTFGYDPLELTLVIFQPRVDPCPKVWELSAVDLAIWREEILIPAVHAAVEADKLAKTPGADAPLPLNAGKHCQFCRAKAGCPELYNQALAAAKDEFADDDSELAEVDMLSDAELAARLDRVPVLEAWTRALRAEASARLDRGADIPGWKLVPKRAMRKWADTGAAEKAFKMLLDEDDFMDRKIKSVAQVEKVLKRWKISLPEGLVVAESSGSTLVQEKDPRKAVGGPASDFED